MTLTPRQSEIVQRLIEGRTTKEIASELQMAIGTLYADTWRAREAAGVRTNAQLIAKFTQESLRSQ